MVRDTGSLLLFEVCQNVDDDLPRVVYADWLEENGHPHWAAFIRTHIEICRGRLDQANYKKNLDDVFRDHVPNVLNIHRFTGTDMIDAKTHRFAFRTLKFWDRGFPATAECREDEWLDYGPNLVKIAPITRVILTDKWPEEIARGRWNWDRCDHLTHPPSHWSLRPAIWDRLTLPFSQVSPDWRAVRVATSIPTAQEDLSAACLKYARELAFPAT